MCSNATNFMKVSIYTCINNGKWQQTVWATQCEKFQPWEAKKGLLWGWNLETCFSFHALKWNFLKRIWCIAIFLSMRCYTQSNFFFYAKWINDSKGDLCKNSLSVGSSFFWNISFQVELVKVGLNYSELILLFKWLALSKAAIYWLSIS